MTSQATTGRITPYEVAFGDPRFSAEEFPAIADEAGRRGLDIWEPERFARLERVARLLEELLPPSAEAMALDQTLQTLFHCFHFWSAGCPLFAFEPPAVQSLVERAPGMRDWTVRMPRPSLYFELPKNLFWARVTETEPPEPVEGLFLTQAPDRESADTHLLVILGVRSDRPGFSVAGIRAALEEVKRSGEPVSYRSDIPGAELAGLYSLERFSEAVVLSLRLLWHLDAHPESLEPVPGADETWDAQDPNALTTLDHVRVSPLNRSR